MKPAGTNKFNVLSRNDYSTLVPGYSTFELQYVTSYGTKPQQGTTQACREREVCTVRGKLPKENSGTGAGFDYYDEESDMEEVNATIEYYEDNSRCGKRTRSGTISENTRKSVRITEEWLFDSGATVHVTPTNTCY